MASNDEADEGTKPPPPPPAQQSSFGLSLSTFSPPFSSHALFFSFSFQRQKTGKRCFVGNLAWRTSWQDLKDKFREVGTVVYANVMRDDGGECNTWFSSDEKLVFFFWLEKLSL